MRGCGCGPVTPPSSGGLVQWLLKTVRERNTVKSYFVNTYLM